MTDISFEDLAAEAGAAGEAAAGGGTEKGTGEWVSETVELLDKRGLLEPMLFGPEGAQQVQEQHQADAEAAAAESDDGGLDLDAESIAEAGRAVMDQLGDDVTVADLVEMCENNPGLVNKQIQENL